MAGGGQAGSDAGQGSKYVCMHACICSMNNDCLGGGGGESGGGISMPRRFLIFHEKNLWIHDQ
jgi:hypothetical protein